MVEADNTKPPTDIAPLPEDAYDSPWKRPQG